MEIFDWNIWSLNIWNIWLRSKYLVWVGGARIIKHGFLLLVRMERPDTDIPWLVTSPATFLEPTVPIKEELELKHDIKKKTNFAFFCLPYPCQWRDPEWRKVLMWRHGGFPDSSLHWHRWAEPLVEPRWGSPDGWKVDSAIAEDTLPSASVNISKHSSQQPKLTSFTSTEFRLAREEIKYL